MTPKTLNVQEIVSTLFGQKWIEKYGGHPDIQWTLLSETMTNKTSSELTEKNSIQSVESQEFIELLVSACINLRSRHLVYDQLGSAILHTCHQFQTLDSFVDTMTLLQENKDVQGRSRPLLDHSFYEFIIQHQEIVDSVFLEEVGKEEYFLPSIFGWKTLYKSYLMKSNGKVLERPVHLWFRVALFLWRDDYEKVRQVFRDFSQGKCTHATPTLFYAGARRPQMASCFFGTSLVDTLRGPIPIKDVLVGDEVVTHQGRVRKVVQLHKTNYNTNMGQDDRERRRMVKIKFANTKPLFVTEDHKLLVYNSDSKKTEWKEVGDMTKKDAVMLPKYEGEMKEVEEKIGECIMNENFFAMVGIWFACGVDCEKGIYLRIPHQENQEHNKLVEFCKNFAPCTLGSKTLFYQDILYPQPELFSFFQQKFGSLSSPKLPIEMYRFPTSFILSFMMGLGCLQKHNGKRYFSCPSESFIDSLYSLCRMRNIEIMKMDFSLAWEDKPLSVIRTFRKFVGFVSKSFIEPKEDGNNSLWDYVYTLGVEEDHSYSIEGIIAQNCFLVGTEDSVQNIFKTIGDVGQISKWAGGLGIHISNIRANRSYIYGTNGYSNGILPMIRLYNDTSRYIDQCFSGNTRILTRQGWREIQSIQRGDQVLTATGNFHAVSRTRHYHSSKETPLFSACSDNHNNNCVYVSGNHDFLV